MQPVEAQKGVSTKSQLLDSLKVYLNNKSRLQPIIGLGSIIECVKAGTHNKEILFLCEVCVCQLNKADMRNHIMGSLHRYNYIKAWHPHLVSEWKEKSDLSKLAWPLMEMAKTLEGKEGPGDVQWLELEDAVYQRIATHSENDENRSSSLNGYTGTEPLVGLLRVVECRGEDGRTYCFLCHCCRVRANENDIIDHLTRTSHLINYLMETHPEQVEVILADINDDYQLLVSLAMEVEKEEGRGEMKVVKTPESLGIQLTGKSYHWCVKMMSNGRKHPDIQMPKRANKDQGMPEKCAVVLSQWPKSRSAKRKMRGVTNPVFKVSLPLTKGSLLLKRSPFIMDSLPVSSAFPHSPDSDLPESPEFHSEDPEVDYDTESFAINPAEQSVQHQQDRHSGEGQAGPFMEPERNVTVTPYQQMDGHYNGNEYFNPSKDITRTTYQKVYGEIITTHSKVLT
ncbi:High affinity nerve growth factor receptor [Dissostichus eleginoides]|uniref:High affinity nerve growth factor receptor n=1 Tax=Dissostichus eleginoides TaxID=100907 RepID=A0AAD9BBF1_DISEL|nr:High affinity nerve growth factor receptor [Dissostichus eleginoides]